MNEKVQGFQCQRCGKCCHNLVSEDKGITRGLTLLPNEVSLFKKENITPALGRGKTPGHPDFQIEAYQLAEEVCPQLKGRFCTVYEDRPVSCKQFPFSLEPGYPGPVLGVDLNCPSARALLETNKKFEFKELVEAEKLLLIKMRIQLNPDLYWFYDLKMRKWVEYLRLK